MAVSLAPLGTPAPLTLLPSMYLSIHSGQKHSLSGVLAAAGMGMDELLMDLGHMGGAVGAQAALAGGCKGWLRYFVSSPRPDERRSSIKRHRSEQ